MGNIRHSVFNFKEPLPPPCCLKWRVLCLKFQKYLSADVQFVECGDLATDHVTDLTYVYAYREVVIL